jgi:multiple sugar transport system permease protein
VGGRAIREFKRVVLPILNETRTQGKEHTMASSGLANAPRVRRGPHSLLSDQVIKYEFIIPAILVLLVLMVYPLGYAINASLHSYFLGKQTGFAGALNWVNAFHDTFFWHAVGITLLYAVIAIPIEMVIALALALALQKLSPKLPATLMGLIRSVMLVPFIVMPVVSGIIWKLMFVPQFGFVNYLFAALHLPAVDWLGSPTGAVAAVIVMDFWIWIPFVFLILFSGLQALPDEPFEAAQVDGATAWQTFAHVTLPLLSPVIVTALSLRTIDALRIFDQVYAMTGGGPGTSTTFISLQLASTAFSELNFGLADAELFIVLVLMYIIIAIYYFVFLRGRMFHA